ncbi:MAG: diguanylate cyclase, partial [Paucimonas sp.]|nr:diguanylate cyclase [Paucimonas sp.]
MLAQECSVLACHWLFDAVRDDYAEQAPLHRSASPAFFSRLLDSTALVAHDAAHHTYTWELESAYLKPHDIRSMLVFPIRVAGHTCAALCFEVTGVQRNWTPDDIANGNQLAEISARVLASHERRLFQNEISELNSRLLDTNEALEARVMERTAALEQRNAELVELNTQLSNMQNQLLQSEKMASIGQLSAGVAHEINNPIGYVYSNISSLEKYLDDLMAMLARYEASESLLPAEERTRLNEFKIECDLEYLREDLPQLMKESREGITRVKKIVMDLRDFSHADTGEMGIHDLNAGLQSTLNLVNNELQKKAKVICEFGELPPVECMLARLNQVFLNLLVNAGHALEGRQGGEIRVRTGCDGEEVSISISDNGCGIKPENMKKI